GAVQGSVTGLHTELGQPLVCLGLFAADAGPDDGVLGLTASGLSYEPDVAAASLGAYTLPGIPPGRYVVAVNPAACQDDGYVSAWVSDGPGRDAAAEIVVVKGEISEAADTVVTPLPSIAMACPPGDPDAVGFD